MSSYYDVVVLGLGAHGSAALYNLSLTGKKVLGIDQYSPPHEQGSSHGQSRIIRKAYHENSMYVPYLKESYRLWDEIGLVSKKKIFLKTGGIMLGTELSSVVTGSRRSAEEYSIPYDYLSAGELRKKFPAFNVSPETIGILEHEAGILFPETCIQTFLEQAAIRGVDINLNEKVKSILSGKDHTEIITDKGRYFTEKLVISAGAWIKDLLPELHLPLSIERQVLYWFNNNNPDFQQQLGPEQMPIFIWEYSPGKMFYGFPDLGDGIKIALHHAGTTIRPDELTQWVDESEIESIRKIAEQYLRMKPDFNFSSVCMYTNTPDENFIIDYYPCNNNIIIVSACSGHGFKFSSWVGKVVSDMANEKKTDLDISVFALNRQLSQNKENNS